MTNFGKAIASAWTIAIARWPIFEVVFFLKHLVFFGEVFSQTNYNVVVESFFSCFLHFLFLTQNDQFCEGYSLCMGYSLCKVADFQDGLICGIFGVFWSRFLTDQL